MLGSAKSKNPSKEKVSITAHHKKGSSMSINTGGGMMSKGSIKGSKVGFSGIIGKTAYI